VNEQLLVTRTTNRAGAVVIVAKAGSRPQDLIEAYCHGCTDGTFGRRSEKRDVTRWAQQHATACNHR
jgi:hypothetical protein